MVHNEMLDKVCCYDKTIRQIIAELNSTRRLHS